MNRFGGIGRRQRGAIGLEYAGMIVIAALVVGTIVVGLTTANLSGKVASAICKVLSAGQGECDAAGGGEGPEDELPDYGGPWSTGEDPGDDVEYPEGLDPNSQAAQDLAATARGRRILQWLHDNGIRVEVDPNKRGAYYLSGTITLGNGNDDGATLTHEAEHARWDAEDLGVDPRDTTKDEFVRISIYEDAQGSWLAVINDKELRASGQEVPVSQAERNYDAAYEAAYDDAIAAGQSPAEANTAADQAGQDRIELMYYNGEFVQSTDGQTYPDKWGQVWEDAQ